MNLRIVAVSTVIVLMVAVPTLAHHSFTTFWNMDQTVAITGIVKEIKLANPHASMVVEVTEPSGEKSLWNITARGSVSALRAGGWTYDTLPVGTTVKVEGSPSRREGAKGLAAGKITRPDGSEVWFGGGGGIPQC